MEKPSTKYLCRGRFNWVRGPNVAFSLHLFFNTLRALHCVGKGFPKSSRTSAGDTSHTAVWGPGRIVGVFSSNGLPGALFIQFLSGGCNALAAALRVFPIVGLDVQIGTLFSFVALGRPCRHLGTLFEISLKNFHLWVNRTFFSFVGLGHPNWCLILICGFGTSVRSFWHPF